MRDDDESPAEEPLESRNHPTEEEWEKRLLENERMKDRYQEVFESDPDRQWDDPVDLHMKVKHGIDLGPDFYPEPFPDDETTESKQTGEGTQDDLEHADIDITHDDVKNIPVYHSAFEFAVDLNHYFRSTGIEQLTQDILKQELLLHAMKIAADIAGGNAMGYDEDALCGNIVKNRWALGHANDAVRLLRMLIQKNQEIAEPYQKFLFRAQQISEELTRRIAELRSKVWWNH